MARLRLMHLGAVLACLSQAAYSLEMKTSDSLLVRMSDQTGHIEAMSISGEAVPLLGAAHPLRVREFKPDALRKNLVPNPGLEAEEGWPFLGEGAARVSEFNHTLNGKYCGKVAAPAGATGAAPATSGQFRSVSFPAKPNTRYLLRAWGLVPQGSSGGNMFVVELDQNGKILLRDNYWHIQHSLGWREIAEGKWVEKELSFTTQPHCAEFHIYANIWKGYGVFYFDDVELLDLSACWKDIALSPASVEATGAGRWRQKLSAPDDQLDFELRYMAQKAHVRIETAIQDTHRPARARSLQVQFVLPVNAVGWTWDDDGRRRRTIATAETVYENSFAAGGSRISRYPFTSIARGQMGLSLGAPLDCPRMQNFLCSPSQGYLTTVDVGLSPLTKRIGEGRAAFTTILFAHDGEWGLRAAAKKYYDLYPEFFAKRAQREGLWFYAVPVPPIPNPEDFGLTFYEGGPLKPEDAAYAKEKGIYVLPYTEPWGARQAFPKTETTEQLPPYEERLAGLRQWAEDKASKQTLMRGPRWEIAQAVLNSLPHDKDGRAPFSVDKYGTWAQWWRTNTNPWLPEPNRGATCKRYEIDAVLPQADGIYLDSVSPWLGNYLNCRQEHFAAAEIPLVFDPATGQPALFLMFSHCEFMDWLAKDLHRQGKLVHMNIFADAYRFCAHLADVLGSEIGSGGRKRNLADVESDELSLMRRLLASQKPTSNLLQEGNFNTPVPELSQAEVEQYIKHQTFYGFFPGIATIGGEEKPGYVGWKRYFGTPAQYERDRALFKKYIPLIKQLCAAGWEPVTYALTSNAAVLIERFGDWDKGNLHFTLRNAGDKADRFTVTIQAARLAVGATDLRRIAIRELLAASPAAVKADDKAASLEVSMSLPSKETAVLRVERQ